MIFLFTLEVMRRGIIKEKFVSVWLITSALMVLFSVYNRSLSWVSEKFNFQNPSNFLFFCSILLLVGISIQISFELGKLEESNRKLTIEIGLIRNEMRRNSEK
jgi:hypothetical protein